MATIQDLCGRYRVGTSAMTDYVKRHINAINYDGDHARLARGAWSFDAVAVQRIDGLRGFGVAGVIEAVESKEIKELKILIDNLQAALLHAQQQTIDATQQVADAERERRSLAEKQAGQTAELATQRARSDSLQRELNSGTVELMRLRRENERLRDELGRMARASIWQRLTGRW